MRIWILSSWLGLTGCFTDAQIRARDATDSAHVASTLTYFEDPRTGLCFAGRMFSYNAAVMTNVPCTDEVRRMIATQPRAAE